jgi:hypothetical protein
MIDSFLKDLKDLTYLDTSAFNYSNKTFNLYTAMDWATKIVSFLALKKHIELEISPNL